MKAFTFEQQQHEIRAATDRERRRIRRALAPLAKYLDALRGGATLHMTTLDHARGELDAATRAPRAKRRRGR